MSEFIDVDLRGSHFQRVDLRGAEFRSANLSDTVMRNVELFNVDIHGDVENLTINDVNVGPLIEAALDARYPLRTKMRPTEPVGFSEAWDTLEVLWGETVERARRLPRELLHQSVNEEWTFIETLRHLVFATDSWIRRAIMGDPSPWDPLGLPWDEMADTSSVPHDRTARPSLESVLALRRDRTSTVRHVIDALTPASLEASTAPVDAPGWPPSRSFPVRECLLIIFNEEWQHRLYAERDLDVLEANLA